MTLFLLNATLKVSLIVVVALAASAMLRRRSAAVRHFVLTAALACAAATPALRFVAPAWQATAAWLPTSRLQLIDRPLAVLDDAAPVAPANAIGPSTGSRWNAAAIARSLGVIWITGVAVGLLVFIIGLVRLARIASRSRRVDSGPWVDAAADMARALGLRRPPVVLQGDRSSLLGTWGVIRSKVLLPADASDWPADRMRIVLGHELAHVRRHDWTVQLVAELLRSVYWFNPFVWLACRRLRLESEQACDDAVLKLGVEGSDYASELVDLARAFKSDRPLFVPAAAMARPSSLERRVRAMLNAKLNRDPITRPASIAAALVLTAVTVVVAGFGASAQSPFGSVSGSVTDQNGRAMAGVTIVLSNAAAQTKNQVKSDTAGHYELVGVPAGTYELTFESIGMLAIKREGLQVSGDAVQVNAVMKIGLISETINVIETRGAPAPAPPEVHYRPADKPDPCATSANGGCIRPPVKIKDVRPIYPTGSAGGVVILGGAIDASGRITGLETLRTPDPSLSSAAMAAVNGWEFLPTHLDGQPIETRITVVINFSAAK
jgi:beta-lactamase regulating signal transducer with metallopeptidase domain